MHRPASTSTHFRKGNKVVIVLLRCLCGAFGGGLMVAVLLMGAAMGLSGPGLLSCGRQSGDAVGMQSESWE